MSTFERVHRGADNALATADSKAATEEILKEAKRLVAERNVASPISPYRSKKKPPGQC